MRRCALCRGLNSPHSPAVFRAWRRCREQGKLHFPCDGLRRLPFCTLAARERLAAASHSLPSSPNERNGGDTIAIYHCSIKIVSRGKGKSAVAAAAYRSGEKLTNEWDGLTHDYTKKGGVVHSEILLPAHAPPAFSDRSTLWNSVELSEKSNNAQLAREVEIALPVELSREEQTRLVREYCSSQFVSKGMIADFNLHDTGGGNPHAHTPMLGKLYARFEPAQKAWRQATYTPLGVVLGRTDPALFLYFFSYGKTMQKEAMEFHLSGLMNSLAVDQKVNNGNIHSLVMSPRENSEEAAVAHAAWHVGMTCGEIFPDSGIYFAAVKQATISDKLTEDIAKNMEQYAISLVRLYAEGAEDK